jgi:hypothetical protein
VFSFALGETGDFRGFIFLVGTVVAYRVNSTGIMQLKLLQPPMLHFVVAGKYKKDSHVVGNIRLSLVLIMVLHGVETQHSLAF